MEEILRMAQDEVERDEDGKLEEDRQARGRGIDVVLPVELHQLLVALLFVVLEALLDRLHLRHVRLHRLHRVDLLDGEGHHQQPHHHGQRDDRPGPREPDRAVQPLEDVAENVLERGDDRKQDHLKSLCCSTWSTPPRLHGLQRSSRQPARITPRTSPYLRSASIAYCEQDGWYLQPPGKRTPSVYRYA